MIWNRGNQDDFNIWAELGNPGWGWDDLLPYFQKSETFTPRYYGNIPQQPVTFNPALHGFQGPVQVSYPEFLWQQTGKSGACCIAYLTLSETNHQEAPGSKHSTRLVLRRALTPTRVFVLAVTSSQSPLTRLTRPVRTPAEPTTTQLPDAQITTSSLMRRLAVSFSGMTRPPWWGKRYVRVAYGPSALRYDSSAVTELC